MALKLQPDFIRLDHIVVPEDVRSRGDSPDLSDLRSGLGLVEGFLHDPLVRRLPECKSKFELRTGYRRYLAAKQAGHPKIFVKVTDSNDEELLKALHAAENLHRKSHPKEREMAAFLKRYFRTLGARGRGGDRRSAKFERSRSNGPPGRAASATKSVAEICGRSERATRRSIKIAEKACAELKRALDEGIVTKHDAERCAGLPVQEQRQFVRDARREARRGKGVDHRLSECIAGLEFILRRLSELELRQDHADLLRTLRALAAEVLAKIDTLMKGVGEGATGGATWH